VSIRGGSGRNSSTDFMLDVSSGQLGNISSVNKFGYSSDIDQTAEEVWDGGTAYSGLLATASTVSATSTSDEDGPGAGGTGALTITVQGLDEDYNAASETLTMNGTGDSGETTTTFLRVFRVNVATAGSTGSNVGTITVASTTPTTMAIISATKGQTLMAIYTVPAGKTAYMTKWYVSCGKGDDISAELYVRTFGGAWNIKHSQDTFQESMVYEFEPYFKIEAKSDIKVMALSSTANTEGSAGFDLVVVDN
jgi:hypothetical protein